MELKGKVALVTGAGSGIGYAIAKRFGQAGAGVVVNYLGYETAARQLAQDLNGEGQKSIAIPADVSSKAAVDDMVRQATEQLGRLDILVNNAGIELEMPFLEIEEADWDKVLNVNLKGAFLCAQACGRVMRDGGGGCIVNISSIHEDFTFPGFTPYCAAKGGLRMMMRNAALELAQFNIRVNNIAPGAIATPINTRTEQDPEKVKKLKSIIPMGRMGRPEEVAELALFLASDASAYVTGSTYYADGGMVRFAEPL